MENIKITVRNKVASVDNIHLVCGNSDYVAEFDFDSEWSSSPAKTARFIYNGQYTDVVFTGNTCSIPTMSNVKLLAIGVYAGNLRTTTPALISFEKSILCDNPVPVSPTPEVYNQIMAILNGFSATVTKTGDTATITIVDPNGTHTATVTDGEDGQDGEDGADGVGIQSIVFKETTAAGNVYTVTMTNGTTYEITAPKGAKGDTGTTEWNGITDKPSTFPPSAHNHDERYFTEEEVNALISAITALIPSQASSSNQLADKSFVNSSIATNTANYIYKTVGGEKVPFDSVAELEAYSGTVTHNDYAFVTGTDTEGNAYFDRYKANVSGSTVTWAKEYRLNNSSFTAVQWAAITSGITAALVTKLNGIETGAEKNTVKGAKIGGASGTQATIDSNGNIIIPIAINSIGVIRDGGQGFGVNSDGYPYLSTYTKTQYDAISNAFFIGKGTLENVLTGKNINDVSNETWTFTLSDNTTVTKTVKVGA